MRVEGAVALAHSRGRYVPLDRLKGPRPLPLTFGPSSAGIEDFGQKDSFGAQFAGRARLYSFEHAYVLFGEGDDGGLITDGFQRVSEPSVFTQMGNRPLPLDLQAERHPQVLENVILGCDGGSRNYYHWLINALGRSWLCAQCSPDKTVLLPDVRAFGDRPGWVKAGVLQASLAAAFEGRPYRLLAPGVHRVRNLDLLWTRPLAPTDITNLPELYRLFDQIAAKISGFPLRRRRRLYLSRGGGHDPRLPASAAEPLQAILDRHGFESLMLEDMTFAQQVDAAAHAEIILAPHGAGLTNLLFSHRSCVVMELVATLNGEDGPRPWFYQLASGRGQRYAAFLTQAPGWLADLDAALRTCLK